MGEKNPLQSTEGQPNRERRTKRTLALLILTVMMVSTLAPTLMDKYVSAGVDTPYRHILKLEMKPLKTSSKDWIISRNETVMNEEVTLDGNLIIEFGGNLTFINTTLYMDCREDGELQIRVKSGGRFNILERSIITACNPDHEFLFHVENGSTLRMFDSELHECGYSQLHPGFLVRTDDAIIRGCVISKNYAGVYCERSNPIITDCVIDNNSLWGIYGWMSNITICNCTVSRNNYGISGYHSSLTIRSCIVRNNTGAGRGYRDIGLSHSNSTISNCMISGSAYYGIVLWGSSLTISNCTISHHEHCGITCEWSSLIMHNCTLDGHYWGIYHTAGKSSISNSTMTSNRNGLAYVNSKGTVCNCVISNNTEGIICSCSSPTIRYSTISDNKGEGISCKLGSAPEIHYCNISSNGMHGLRNTDSYETVNATYNWWGSLKGPEQKKEGDAYDPEEVYGNIIYKPWLTKPATPQVDITPPTITILSPENRTYPTTNIQLNFTVSEQVSWVGYSLDGKANVTVTGNIILTDLSDGVHTITVHANNTAGNMGSSETVYFSIRKPVLSVSTFKNDVPIISNITLFDENKTTTSTVKNVSSHDWLLPPATYYLQASIFYNAYVYESGQIQVNLTGCTELAINFRFGNLTVSCLDIENRPLKNCTVIFTRENERRITYTNSLGLTTLEAYYGNWAIQVYWMDVSVAEVNVSVGKPEMRLDVLCNVGEVIVTVVNQYGDLIRANVTLANVTYDLSFSGCLDGTMKNLTFTQIPLIDYKLIIKDGFESQTETVNTNITRNIQVGIKEPRVFNVVWETTAYPVTIISNSTISNFDFNQTKAEISFNVTGTSDTVGYCNATIPKNLLGGTYTVYVDDLEVPFTKTENSTHSFLYFMYNQSIRTVQIQGTEVIPEFPLTIVLPLLMVATLISLCLQKLFLHRHRKSSVKKNWRTTFTQMEVRAALDRGNCVVEG